MLNNKDYFKQLETTLAVKELDNETAATIQGGAALHIYQDINFGKYLSSAQRGWRNLGKWNDKMSSVKITSGTWRFWEHANYKGASFLGRPGNHPKLPRGWNDRVSSIDLIGDGVGPS